MTTSPRATTGGPTKRIPNGPYIRRDGFTNPANFDDHRKAMVRLSLIVPALAAAWELTGEKKYADHAGQHLRAWFVDPATKMNANLEYAQAIFNLNNGRGIGIIDTLHLVEPARAATVLANGGVLEGAAADQRLVLPSIWTGCATRRTARRSATRRTITEAAG